MAKFIYPNSITLPGPWLIDFDKLKQLDQILEEEWLRIVGVRENGIKKEIQERLKKIRGPKRKVVRKKLEKEIRERYRFSRENKTVTIHFKDGNKMTASSFKEAAKEKSIQDKLPTGFELEMEYDEIRINLSAGKVGEYNFDDLKFSVIPASYADSSDLFFKVESWIKSLSPPKWLIVWKKIKGFHWFILYLVLLVSAVIAPDKAAEYKKTLIPKAHELMENGIQQDEVSRAVEILISIETKYYPKDFAIPHATFINWYIFFVGLVFVLSMILQFPPNSYLGLGNGETKIERCRFWLRLVSITIPSLILTSIILPLVVDKIKKLII